MRSEAAKKAQAKYQKKYNASGVFKQFVLKCHKVHDKDIFDKLESLENKNGYIKELIRVDIERNKS